jgi:hypothetical protein
VIKAALIEHVMIRFGYDKLPVEQQVATRKVYMRMTKTQLEAMMR